MKKLHFVFLSFSLILLTSFSTQIIDNISKETLIHEGLERTYFLHIPKNYDVTKGYPLVIGLHGGGGKAKKFNRSTKGRFNELSDEEGFIIVYPQGIDKSWNDHNERNSYGEARQKNINDVGFIEALIEKLEEDYNLDSNYIFACGISNGGLMSATLATRLHPRIKAIGMVSSNFSKAHFKEMKETNPEPFPIIIIQGTEDPIFPYNEGEIALFKQKRGEIIGAEKSISFMLSLNGNTTEGSETQLPNNAPFDQCKSVLIEYSNQANPNLKVSFIKVFGGGHTWPGGIQYLPKGIIGKVTRDFNAADQLWEFFKSTME